MRLVVRCLLVFGFLIANLAFAADPVRIRYACTDGANSLPIIKRIVSEFEREHPNIKIDIVPVVSGTDYTRKLLAMFAANIAPDIARIGGGDYRGFAQRKALLPIGDFAARDPIVKLDTYYPNTIQAFTFEGKLWVLPRSISSSGLIYYNKRLFREAGLELPDDKWTWDFQARPELGSKCFINCVQRLTRRLESGKTTQFGFASSWPQLWFQTLMVSSGLSMWDNDAHPTKLTATNPEVIHLFQFASDSVNKHHWLPSNSDLGTNNSNVHDEFVKGNIAMFLSGAWECKRLREEMKDDWDITVFPRFRNEPLRTNGEMNGTCIFSSTKHPRESWEFVKWMSGPHGMIPLAQAGLDQPAIRKLTLSDAWLPGPTRPLAERKPENLRVTDIAAMSVTNHFTPDYFADIADACQGTMYDVLTGIGDPRIKLEALQSKAGKSLEFILKRQESTQPYPFVPATIIGVLLVIGLGAWVYWPERNVRYTQSQKKDNRSAYWFLLPWLAGLAMTFGPMIYSFFLSFSDSDIIQTPKWVGLNNYLDAVDATRDDTFWISLRVTLYYAILSIPLGMMVALSLALLLNTKVKGIPLWRALYYIPSLASGVAVSLIWMKVFNPETGLLNSLIYGPDGKRNLFGLGDLLSHLAGSPNQPINWLGNPTTVIPAFIIMGMWGAGGGTIIFLAGLQGISTTYYEAAILDGANRWRQFRNVTLPLLTPTLFFSLITGVIGALQVFTQAFVMTQGGPDRATYFYMLNLYNKAFGQLKMGYASALAWILFAIILVITVIQLQGSKRWVYYEGDLKA